jgi:glucose/mannose-6-phosphate isomerase
MSLVLLGDLVSFYLAILEGIDPTPVEAIENFKAALD